MEYGLPATCPRCPPKHYYGSLLGYKLPRHSIVIKPRDRCENCGTQLVVLKPKK